MVTSSHSQLNLTDSEVFFTGFALKHLVGDRDCCKPPTRTCWRSLKSVRNEWFDLPHVTHFRWSKDSCHRGVYQVRPPGCGALSRLQPHIIHADRKSESIDRAEKAFNHITKELKVPFAPVSTLKETWKEYGGLLRSVTSLFRLKLLLLQERCSWIWLRWRGRICRM